MIKKLIGIIVAVAVVVIIVVAAIRRDNFQSMVRRDELLNGVEPAAEPPHLISPETVPQISASRFRAG